MAYLMYVSAALTHLWAIYAPQNQYWIMKGCRTAIRFVSQLVSIAPVYYVNGNHEAKSAEHARLRTELETLGVRMLENQAEMFDRGDASLQIIGVNDPRMAHEPSVSDAEIMKKELISAGVQPEAFSLLLSHRPELLDVYAEAGVSLALTGHAHGGQIRLPFVGGLLAPHQGWFPRFADGLHRQGETAMIVSRGVGNSLFPIRVHNRPELLLIFLICN